MFDIAPYRKKPKLNNKLIKSVKAAAKIPSNFNDIKLKDALWKICLALDIPNTPMWIGFQSRIIKDNLPIHKISYLPQINESPTSTSVVKETLNIALRVAEECQQQYMHVTYDLAISKIALQIQHTEQPLYNNLFISLGPFHIMLSLFKAIGKFVNSCGLTDIVCNAGLLASGSIMGFLTGKSYSRCKRLHPLIAASLQILHFKQYLKTESIEVTEELLYDLSVYDGTDNITIRISKFIGGILNNIPVDKEYSSIFFICRL